MLKQSFAALCAVLAFTACSRSSGEVPADRASLASPVYTGDYVWDMVPEKSTLTFTAQQDGKEFTGRFDSFDVAVQLSPNEPQKGKIHATIDMGSFDAGDGDRNGVLPGEGWFFTKSFPTATFVSTDIRKPTETDYIATGDLTIKGISKQVALPFNLKISGSEAKAVGELTIDRTTFDVGATASSDGKDYSDPDWIAHSVTIAIDITAKRQP